MKESKSPWDFPENWGWVLANPRILAFRECKGSVGFFKPKGMTAGTFPRLQVENGGDEGSRRYPSGILSSKTGAILNAG